MGLALRIVAKVPRYYRMQPGSELHQFTLCSGEVPWLQETVLVRTQGVNQDGTFGHSKHRPFLIYHRSRLIEMVSQLCSQVELIGDVVRWRLIGKPANGFLQDDERSSGPDPITGVAVLIEEDRLHFTFDRCILNLEQHFLIRTILDLHES